ncbi:unnamed protein product [Paramecium pentaurelia]|uniref:Uncharacterized protein n=1 Tax=Paramecium pentaurelia TaxID=43138 RepID=A0A8S1WKT6_9CILI|nr:unnamed protein product [Paramecium pentaurelia]
MQILVVYFGKQFFHLIDCSIFDKGNFQESSYKCVFDGSICLQFLECRVINQRMNVLIKISIVIIAFGLWGSEKQSIFTLCKVFPIYLTNNSICKECFDGFIISEYGYGLIEQMESCSYYVNVLKVKEYCFGIKLKQNVLKRCVKIYHLFRIINVSHIELIVKYAYNLRNSFCQRKQ